MSDSGFERFASGAGNLFFLAAIVLFVTLILLATGTVRAEEYPIADSLEPDVLGPDALEPDALDEDALGLERVDPALIRQLAAQPDELPIAEIPPRPPQAIPMYFCWRCWAWHLGLGPPEMRLDHGHDLNGAVVPHVLKETVPTYPEKPKKIAKEGETK